MAQWLGVNSDPPFGPEFLDVSADDRLNVVQQGEARLVLGLAITDQRDQLVRFAGPYLLSRSALLIRSESPTFLPPASNIGQPTGRVICVRAGSTTATEVSQQAGVIVQQDSSIDQCVFALKQGSVSAVAGDEIELLGLSREDAGLVVPENSSFGPIQQYGFAIPKSSSRADCELLTDQIRTYIDSGSWTANFRNSFGPTIDANRYRPDPSSLRPCAMTD